MKAPHLCTVCDEDQYAHESLCYNGESELFPHRHYPPMCCPGCDCGRVCDEAGDD